jgi:hypothetical protein
MRIFTTIHDYFGEHVSNVTVQNITITDFMLGALTILDVSEYEDEENGLGYAIEVEENPTTGLIVVRNDTQLGRGYYSLSPAVVVNSAEWSDYVCQTSDEFTDSAEWSEYVCAKEDVPENYTAAISIDWVDSNVGETDGLGGTVWLLPSPAGSALDSQEITAYLKTFYKAFSVASGQDCIINWSQVLAYLIASNCTWYSRWRQDLGDWSTTGTETGVITGTTSIEVEIKTSPFS